MMRAWIGGALVLCMLMTPVGSLMFDLPSGKVKCFSEDLPAHTMVEGKFRAQDVPEGQNRMPIEIQVTDPMEKVLFSKDDIGPKQAVFAFTTSVAGDYIVCFHNKGIAEFMTQRRVTFSMVHGIDARDYSQVMQTEHLTKLQVALREMEDRADEIREEFAQEKKRERTMRDLTEATCSRVLWFGIFTLIMLVGTSVVQYYDLYKVLKKGKYVD